MLNVTLLGGALFFVDRAVVRSDLGPAGRLLACYVFEFQGRVHRRERLADLFWGDADPDKARSALNTAIWRIRKMLDLGAPRASRHLVTVGDDVILEPSPLILIDTHQFEGACRRMLSPHANASSELDFQDVTAAVEGYGGPFSTVMTAIGSYRSANACIACSFARPSN